MKNETADYNNNHNINTLTKPNENSSRSITISNQKQIVGSTDSPNISHDTRIQSESSDVFNGDFHIHGYGGKY